MPDGTMQPTMPPRDFIRKWQGGSPAHALNERAGAQAHFIDLCRVLGVPEPADPEAYCFERGVARTGGAGLRTDGVADPRYLATCLVAKHRLFVWLHRFVVPENVVIVVARADDTTFGVLHSGFHELWSLRLGTSLEDRRRYTPTTCFETFPFPAGLTPADTAHQRTEALPDGALILADLQPATRTHAEAVAGAAKRLTDLRDAWLNPPEWTERVPEVVPLGMDQRPIRTALSPSTASKRSLPNAR